ncbi:hypothetical protein [Providencia sp.]|uniref:hypothetical protein n=1 Tax=Providencia sp. TaxID=589 RepID=UPI0033415A37
MFTNTQKSSNPTFLPPLSSSPANKNSPLLDNALSISNLPAEIIQKIAFNFNSQDYSNLRSSSVSLYSALDSFEYMEKGLTSGFSGNLEKTCEAMIADKSIRELFLDKTKHDIGLILKCCAITNSPDSPNEVSLHAPYFADKFNKDSKENGRVLDDCRKEIANESNYMLIPSGADQANIPPYAKEIFDLFSRKTRMVEMNLDMTISDEDLPENLTEEQKVETKKIMTKKNIDCVFKSFNNIFNESSNNEQHIIAICAEKLRQHWISTPPNGIGQDDIINLSSEYKALFSKGKNLIERLSTINCQQLK